MNKVVFKITGTLRINLNNLKILEFHFKTAVLIFRKCSINLLAHSPIESHMATGGNDSKSTLFFKSYNTARFLYPVFCTSLISPKKTNPFAHREL